MLAILRCRRMNGRSVIFHNSIVSGAEEKHPAPARYVTAYAADYNNNKTFCTADTVSVPVLPPPDDVDHVFSFLGALLSSRRFAGSSILSCCSYSVVGAYRLIETGKGPLDSFWGFPGSVFPIQSRGLLRVRG